MKFDVHYTDYGRITNLQPIDFVIVVDLGNRTSINQVFCKINGKCIA